MTPLHDIGTWIRDLLAASPLSAVRVLFIAGLTGLLIWVLRLPAERTTEPGTVRRRHRDLRVWAALALGIQILIYSLL